MPKILILTDDPRINTGFAYTNRNTIKWLKSFGYEIATVGYNSFSSNIGEYEGVPVYPNEEQISSNENEKLYGTKKSLLKLYENINPDILFFHNDFYRQAWYLELPDEIKNKSVWWLPFDVLRKNHTVDVSYFSLIKNLVFVTKHAAEIVGLPHHKVIHHAIDEAYFEDSIVSHRPDLENKFVVCRVDRHQPRKQWPYSLVAFSNFARNKNDVHFIAKCDPQDSCGHDPDTMDFIDLEEICDRYQLSRKKIEFIRDFLPANEIRDKIYKQSDIFLTTTGSEGFGLSVAESMACGCIPMVPNGSSVPEVIGNAFHYLHPYIDIRMTKALNTEYGRPDIDGISKLLEKAYLDWKMGYKDLAFNPKEQIKSRAKEFHPLKIYSEWDMELKIIIEKNKTQINITPLENKIKYSIIIPTFNHLKDCLEPCIKSILEQSDMSDKEIIIVANGCTDETQSFVKFIQSLEKNVILLDFDQPLGYPRAINEGVKKARGEYIILLNNDIGLVPMEKKDTWINILQEPFDKYERVGITGPIKFNWDCEDISLECMAFWCVMISKKLFDEIGLLDEIFSPGMGEDGDFSFKAHNAGYKLVKVPDNGINPIVPFGNPDIIVHDFPIYHKGCGTFDDDVPFKNKIREKNQKILEERYGPRKKENKFSFVDKIKEKYKNNSTIMEVGNDQDVLNTYEIPDRFDYIIFFNLDTDNLGNLLKNNPRWYLKEKYLKNRGLIVMEKNR
jgi:glycosyltransferase involved in cell wall biosynthesis